MKYEDEDNIVVIPKEFEGLEECYRYYIGIVHFLRERNDEDDLEKKEFKRQRKFVMKQLNENLKLLKSQGEYSRKQEANKLKPPRMKQAEEAAKQHLSQGDQKQSLEPPKTAPQLPPTQQEETNEIDTEIEN